MANSDYSEQMKKPVYSDVLLELSPNLVIFLDSGNVVCSMSQAARQYFSPEKSFNPVGQNIFSLVKNPVLTLFMKKWEEKLNKGVEIDETFPLDLNQKDHYEWFQVRAKSVDFEGRLIGKVFFVSNITELYSQKKILDTLMGSFPGDVIVFDRTLRILLISDSVARRNGFHSWRDVAGKSLRDLPKLDVSYIEAILDRIILTDEPIHDVLKQPRAQGESRWYYVDVRTIKSTAGVFGYIMTQFDITGEIKPKAILEAIMDSSSDSILIVNPEGIVEYASKVMVHAYGIQDWRSVVNHPWSHIFRSANMETDAFSELYTGDLSKSRQGTIALEAPDGKQHYNYRIDPLAYQSENFGIMSIATNTTELVSARDRAESAVRAKAAFFANMSHELRTPINAVLGMNELLSRTPLSSLQKNYAAYIKSSASLLLSTINDILDFSRMEDWKLGLNVAPYDTANMIQDVIKQVVLKTIERELSFTVDLDPAIPASLIGDELRVRQILINLLNNAVKFTDQGEINLSVAIAGKAKGDSVLLSFRVRDTGIGIPKEKQQGLFERFSRIENGRNVSVEGSGLGLSICKGLVSLMGGTISVESDEGAGSVFTARITQAIPPAAEPLARFGTLASVSALVYEEDAPSLGAIKRMCATAGVKMESCSSEAEFERLISDARFAWTHVIFGYRGGYQRAVAAVKRHPSVKWLALLSLADFIGTGKDPAIDFHFRPLIITSFAKFLRGEHVDFASALPMSNGLGVGQQFFRANGVRALVVDDSSVNRKVSEGFLRALDIQVDEAESGIEALAKTEKNMYDLILLDHLMPGMDGVETAVRLRKVPGYRATPIIAMTANSGSEYTEMYRKAGMNDVIHKPVDFNEFAACIKRWLPVAKIAGASISERESSATESSAAAAVPAAASRVDVLSSPAGASSAKSDWIPGLDRESGIGFTGSPENLEMILKVFARTGPKMLDQFEAGRRSGNVSLFRTATHSLISSCANIGGEKLSSMARDLEQAIIAGNVAVVDALYPDVHSELEKIIAGVREHLGQAGSPAPVEEK
jgi:signal transduction histidine kinase/CheY-like chemotaxis protein/HPt (histidine-containing phosphotransfer) domain-containing protein